MKRLLLGSSATVILCAGVYGGLSWLVVEQSLVAKPKESTGVPSILGMEFEEGSFSPHDEPHIQLSGWWIPNPNSSRTLRYVHGLDGAKDQRLGFLQELHSNGYSIFAFDLRGHGESDKVQMGAGQQDPRVVDCTGRPTPSHRTFPDWERTYDTIRPHTPRSLICSA